MRTYNGGLGTEPLAGYSWSAVMGSGAKPPEAESFIAFAQL